MTTLPDDAPPPFGDDHPIHVEPTPPGHDPTNPPGKNHPPAGVPDPSASPTPEAITAAFQPLRLYRADDLDWHKTAMVILFGNQTEADAGQVLLPDTVCCAWSGDRRTADQHDWSPLARRDVFIWPVASRDSTNAAQSVLRLVPHAVLLRTPPDWTRPGLSTGMSIADAAAAGWTPAEAQNHLKSELQRIEDEYERTRHALSDDAAEAEAAARAAGELTDAVSDTPADPTRDWPFRLLGYDDNIHYYLPDESQQIRGIEGHQHTRGNLVCLAPVDFWEKSFPSNAKSGGANWNFASDTLIRMSYKRGLFNPSIIRGRGCWIDRTPGPAAPGPPGTPGPADRVVFHAGDQIICNRQAYPLAQFQSRYVYARGHAITPESAAPLSNADAHLFQDLCCSLSWADPIYGRFLAGWCVAAMICGALRWRPHIWITGEAGSGKSWVVENIVNSCLERFKLSALSASTEAGMRQSIRSDAMPIVLDEAESEDEKGRARFKSILDLVRQSSSESGGAILKGTMSGSAMEFRVRSCFCFASIGVAAVARADTSRITTLTLTRHPDNHARFETTKRLAAATVLRPEYTAALRARAISLAVEIRENAAIFSHALALKLNDNRTADQIGAMLAGAYALSSTRVITPAEAGRWIDAQDWSVFLPADTDKDQNRALSTLLDHVLRVDGRNGGSETTSVGELVLAYYDVKTLVEERAAAARELLLRGLKITGEHIDISCSHAEIAKIYAAAGGGVWAGKWKDQLGRISGKEGEIKSARFGASFHRAIRLKKSVFVQD